MMCVLLPIQEAWGWLVNCWVSRDWYSSTHLSANEKNVKSIRLMPCVVRCFQYGPLKGHQTISVISRLIIQIRPSWNKIIASDWGIQGQSAQAFVQWWSLCMQPIFSSTMNLEFDSNFHAENWEGWFSGPLLHHFGPMFVLCLQVSFSLTWLIQGLIKTQSLVIDDNSYSITSQNGPGRGYYPYAPCKTMVPFGVAEWERVPRPRESSCVVCSWALHAPIPCWWEWFGTSLPSWYLWPWEVHDSSSIRSKYSSFCKPFPQPKECQCEEEHFHFRPDPLWRCGFNRVQWFWAQLESVSRHIVIGEEWLQGTFSEWRWWVFPDCPTLFEFWRVSCAYQDTRDQQQIFRETCRRSQPKTVWEEAEGH